MRMSERGLDHSLEVAPGTLAEVFTSALKAAAPALLVDSCRALRTQLSAFSPSQIEESLRGCGKREGALYVLRGLLVWQWLQHVPGQRGGRGRVGGRGAALKALANRLNRSADTLRADLRLTLFLLGLEPGAPGTRVVYDPSFLRLPREFVVAALAVGREHAWQALEMAACKHAHAPALRPYTLRQFRQDLEAAFPSASKSDSKCQISLRLDETDCATLAHLVSEWQTDCSGVVSRLLSLLPSTQDPIARIAS